MEGSILPNRPLHPAAMNRPARPHPILKFSYTTLPLPPQSQTPPSFPLDSLLQHLLNLSASPDATRWSKPQSNSTQMTSLHISVDSSENLNGEVHPRKRSSVSVLQLNGSKEEGQLGDGSLEFLSSKGKFMLDSIVEQPLHSLNDFFDSNKFMLLEADIFSLLKALYRSGNWERALLFFEWVVLNFKSANVKIDNQVVELMVRILGRESQHSIVSKLLDVIPLENYSLDVRAS